MASGPADTVTIRAMRRCLAILLLVFLPLQFSWAAAAGYCQHQKESPQATHPGHHSHQHDSATDVPADGSVSIDLDCQFCNLSFLSFIPTLSPLPGGNTPAPVAPLIADFHSADSLPFDRPPLARLA